MVDFVLALLLLTPMTTQDGPPDTQQQAAAVPARTETEPDQDFNMRMVHSTFALIGQSAAGNVQGSGFILGVPLAGDPNRGAAVLVTAAHVIGAMQGDSMIIMGRAKSGSSWHAVQYSIKIREAGRPLWTQHPRADVAVMHVNLPPSLMPAQGVSSEKLASDETLRQLEIHPGDELEVLGFPLGNPSNGSWFPVLRSGKIASYPIIPTKDNPSLLLDFRIFRGNSGGPVYMFSGTRMSKGNLTLGDISCVIGLVSKERIVTEQSSGLYESRSITYPLGLAEVVPASFILETIKMLPPIMDGPAK